MADQLLLKLYRNEIKCEDLINWLEKKETAVDLVNNDSDRLTFVTDFLLFLRESSAIQKQDLIHSGLTPRKQPAINTSKKKNECTDKENSVESPNVIKPRPSTVINRNEDVLPGKQRIGENRSRHRLLLGNFLTKEHSTVDPEKNNVSPITLPATFNLDDEESFPAIGSPSIKKVSLIRFNRRIKPTPVSKQKSCHPSGNFNTAFAETNDVKEACTSFNEERLLLKEKLNIQNEKLRVDKTDKNEITEKTISAKIENVELSEVSSKSLLDDFAKLYAFLIQDHLVPSLFLELYFIFQLLTVPGVEVQERVDLGMKTLFVSASNCVYFASCTLFYLRNLLKFLDTYTINLLSENFRLQAFCPPMINFLKQHLDTFNQETKIFTLTNSIQGVAFHSETDNRRNFVNDQEFHFFKKKRDIFYGLIREWESKKDDPNWFTGLSFENKIRSVVELGKHPSTHIFFTRLFQAQLVVMCKDDFQAEFDNGNDILDRVVSLKNSNLEKLKMLNKRFWTPKFGGALPPPTFPSYQEFFKTFICVASSSTFNQYLTDVLVLEISELHYSLVKLLDETSLDQLVKLKVLSMLMTLKLLSKFLGLVIFLPYSTAETMSKDAENVILSARNFSRPVLDFSALLKSAGENDTKFFIIFWLVDFLSMMDSVAPKISYYQKLIQDCFIIYRSLRLKDSYSFVCFRLILEWLFQNNRLLCYERMFENINFDIGDDSTILNKTTMDFLKVFYQQVLYLVCPYLSELKQLLVNCNQGAGCKSSSTRKIKPTTTSVNSSLASVKQLQIRLEENFLHNQPNSVKGLVEFISDMVSSSMIKYTRGVILPAFKKESSDELNRIRNILKEKNHESLTIQKVSLANELLNLANSMTTNIKEAVINYTKRYCDKHILKCIRPLIPNNPLKSVEDIIVQLIICTITQRVGEWMNDHVNENILYKDMLQEVQKHHKDALSSTNSANHLNGFHDSNLPFPSEIVSVTKSLLKRLWTIESDDLTLEEVSNNLNLMSSILENRQDVNQLTLKIALQLNIDLAISIAYQQPDLLNEQLENTFMKLWIKWRIEIGSSLMAAVERYSFQYINSCKEPSISKIKHFTSLLADNKLLGLQD